jgi:hypothetical protein
VSGGTLQVTAPAVNDFISVTLDGTAQVATAPIGPFAVTDARGTGIGWTMNIQATPLGQWDEGRYVPGGDTLPEGSLILPGLSVASAGTDSVAPALVTGPYTLDSGPITLARASSGTGMGRFRFTPTGPLRVAVPVGAHAGTYRGEVSISVISGP